MRVFSLLRFPLLVGYVRDVRSMDRERKTVHTCYWMSLAIITGSFFFAVVAVLPVLIVILAVCMMIMSLIVLLCASARCRRVRSPLAYVSSPPGARTACADTARSGIQG